MAINTPSFNPNQPVPNDPFLNDNKEFLIQTGDRMMPSGALIVDGETTAIEARGIVGDIDCGVLGS
jgi:hypothetical protein